MKSLFKHQDLQMFGPQLLEISVVFTVGRSKNYLKWMKIYIFNVAF